MQLLEADAEGRAAAAAVAAPSGGAPRGASRVDPDRVHQLEARVDALESTVALLLAELGLEAPPPVDQDGSETQSPS